MSKFLPTDGCKWLDPAKCKLHEYEIVLKYPKKWHKLHNRYPLAPHTLEMVSDYELKIADKYII